MSIAPTREGKPEWLKCRNTASAMKIRKVLIPATEQVDSYTVSSRSPYVISVSILGINTLELSLSRQ